MPAELQSEAERLEARALSLRGCAVAGVRYIGWWTHQPSEPGAYIRYVELQLTHGASCLVSTTETFGTNGIFIYEGTYDEPETGDAQVSDVSGSAPWKALVGDVIVGALVIWSTSELPTVTRTQGAVKVDLMRTRFPPDLELRFRRGGVVVLSASSLAPDGSLVPEQENVAVIANSSEAERLGVGSWRGRLGPA